MFVLHTLRLKAGTFLRTASYYLYRLLQQTLDNSIYLFAHFFMLFFFLCQPIFKNNIRPSERRLALLSAETLSSHLAQLTSISCCEPAVGSRTG